MSGPCEYCIRLRAVKEAEQKLFSNQARTAAGNQLLEITFNQPVLLQPSNGAIVRQTIALTAGVVACNVTDQQFLILVSTHFKLENVIAYIKRRMNRHCRFKWGARIEVFSLQGTRT